MKLFENYTNQFNTLMSNKRQAGNLTTQQFSNFAGTDKLAKAQDNNLPAVTNDKVLITFDRNVLVNLFGNNPYSFTTPTIGTHPDFGTLKHNETEYHYCVSMFVDIKGSTRLSAHYSLPQIRQIKDTLLTLCIHVANFFGGHVHRLQGDGIFLQFVRKGMSENDAIINALNAASLLCQFVKTDLSKIFEEKGLKPLRIRVGMDYGAKDDVLWSHYGLVGCTELTTTSLHTDLAAKLQGDADSNEIRIGKNIREHLDLPDEFYSVPTYNGKPDYYIYQDDTVSYNKYIFNWQSYLKTFDFVKGDPNGKDLMIEVPTLRLRCTATNGTTGHSFYYNQNSLALDKGLKLKYEIVNAQGHVHVKKDFETITWRIINRGKEAGAKNELSPTIQKDYQNKVAFDTSTAYLGHHYMECSISTPHGGNAKKMKFPIYVK
jgi:class 3 adenylate cyclase